MQPNATECREKVFGFLENLQLFDIAYSHEPIKRAKAYSLFFA